MFEYLSGAGFRCWEYDLRAGGDPREVSQLFHFGPASRRVLRAGTPAFAAGSMICGPEVIRFYILLIFFYFLHIVNCF